MYLMAMVDFWKNSPMFSETVINDRVYRELFFAYLAQRQAQSIVWNLGHRFFTGGLHGHQATAD